MSAKDDDDDKEDGAAPTKRSSPLPISIDSSATDEKVSPRLDNLHADRARQRRRGRGQEGNKEPYEGNNKNDDNLDGDAATSHARIPFDVGRIIAQGPEAEALAQQYATTLARHSRLNPANTPSVWSRLALLAFTAMLFWYALQGRLRVIEWKRSLRLDSESWEQDYTNWERMMPMGEDELRLMGHHEL